MNIMFMFHSPIVAERGGVERVTSLLGEELERRGNKVVYLCYGTVDDQTKDEVSKKQLFLTGNDESKPDEYLKLVQELKIDVIINQEPTAQALDLLAITPKRVKKVSAYHVQPFRFIGKERLVKRALRPSGLGRKIYRLISIAFPIVFRRKHLNDDKRTFGRMVEVSDKIVLLSDKFIPRVKKYFPSLSSDKFTAVNNPNTFDEIAAGNDWSAKEKLIIYVGRIEETPKNVKGFIDMWCEFSKTHPDWKAEIVGDGNARMSNEAYATKRGVKNLVFVGRRTNVQDYYCRAQCVCLTSHYEGWGMCLTEGMAYGCIPVCYDSYESSRDIIADGVDGIIARAFSAKDMAARIAEVADNPAMASAMSKAATEKVGTFALSPTVDKWEELLCNL